MTSIAAVSGDAAAAPRTDAQKAALNYDAFLKLLLQQLKSQDPTNPVDQSESLAQLASFSTVEQAIKLNEKLDTLLRQSSANESAALIGKHVDSLVSTAGGVVSSVEISAAGTFAILANGDRINVVDGIRIRAG